MAPGELVKVPGLHAWQLVDPGVSWNDPALHAVHPVEPVPASNVPALQGVQLCEPSMLAKEPVPHAAATGRDAKLPARRRQLGLDGRLVAPGSHSRHVVAPVAGCALPAAQSRQLALPVDG